MRYFRIRNFDRFQHYRDRRPPWIKLYNDLLEDYEFSCLQDASKMHLVAIWLLASRSENRVPWDPAWIGGRIGATEPVDLDALHNAGFIELISEQNQPCSEPLAGRYQDASETLPSRASARARETETETETETEKKNPGARAHARRGCRLPDDWRPSDSARQFASARLPADDVNEQIECFRDYWHGKAGAAATKVDWDATWRNWIRRAEEQHAKRSGRGKPAGNGNGARPSAVERVERANRTGAYAEHGATIDGAIDGAVVDEDGADLRR